MERIKYLIILIAITSLAGCTKEVPKELLENQTKKPNQEQKQQQQMPDDDIHRNIGKNQDNTSDTSVTKGDPKAEELMKIADEARAKFEKTKSEKDKQDYLQKELTAANYLMFEANLSPKKKYKPALQRYNKILALDPKNEEALENKQQIEDIYKQMGMPIPN
jgi:predicted small lipoprotein YifL